MTAKRWMLKCRLQLKTLWLRVLRQDHQYPVGPFILALPPEHALPRYQAQYPDYDRFLTRLAAELAEGAVVIDVGANCGDSAAALLTGNSALQLLCIEADVCFNHYLQQNLARMHQQCPRSYLQQVQALVGLTLKGVSLVGQAGTKKALLAKDHQHSTSSEGLNAVSLDQVWQAEKLGFVSLLKIDVDGFDYDVLDSAAELIKAQLPMLFFEYQCDNEQQQQGYQRTLQWLLQQGYCHWLVFDNFGCQMLYTSTPEPIMQLQTYLCSQRGSATANSIEYFDIFATTNNQLDLIQKLRKL